MVGVLERKLCYTVSEMRGGYVVIVLFADVAYA